MGNRLSKIYTRTGDDGSTGLGDGSRVSKDSARVAAYGTVDEANSAIGLVLAADLPPAVREVLVSVQHHMFDLGGELCIPGHAAVFDADIEGLEQTLDAFNADLPPLKDFILPGGGLGAAGQNELLQRTQASVVFGQCRVQEGHVFGFQCGMAGYA
jgi:cob(I)alamin adenosyltransferase